MPANVHVFLHLLMERFLDDCSQVVQGYGVQSNNLFAVPDMLQSGYYGFCYLLFEKHLGPNCLVREQVLLAPGHYLCRLYKRTPKVSEPSLSLPKKTHTTDKGHHSHFRYNYTGTPNPLFCTKDKAKCKTVHHIVQPTETLYLSDPHMKYIVSKFTNHSQRSYTDITLLYSAINKINIA